MVSLQYLKKEFSYEADVLHADKHESLLQVDSIIFDGCGLECSSSWIYLQYHRDIVRKKSGMKLGTLLHCLVQILLLKCIVMYITMFSHH